MAGSSMNLERHRRTAVPKLLRHCVYWQSDGQLWTCPRDDARMYIMSHDIFKFWESVESDDVVHPADTEVLSRLKETFSFPTPYVGPLRTAKVVFLYLSPGLSEDDLVEAGSAEFRERAKRAREGREPMPSQEEHPAGAKWWYERTKCLGFKWEDVRSKIAGLEISPYHSRQVPKQEALISLPSARASVDWAQNVLFPEAVAGKRLVVCLRSRSCWGLKAGKQGDALYAPNTTRGGHMHHSALRNEIIRRARDLLG